MKREAQDREAIIAKSQQKHQIISEYHGRAGRCKQALDMMQKAGSSPSVIIEVIKDLVNDIAD